MEVDSVLIMHISVQVSQNERLSFHQFLLFYFFVHSVKANYVGIMVLSRVRNY